MIGENITCSDEIIKKAETHGLRNGKIAGLKSYGLTGLPGFALKKYPQCPQVYYFAYLEGYEKSKQRLQGGMVRHRAHPKSKEQLIEEKIIRQAKASGRKAAEAKRKIDVKLLLNKATLKYGDYAELYCQFYVSAAAKKAAALQQVSDEKQENIQSTASSVNNIDISPPNAPPIIGIEPHAEGLESENVNRYLTPLQTTMDATLASTQIPTLNNFLTGESSAQQNEMNLLDSIFHPQKPFFNQYENFLSSPSSYVLEKDADEYSVFRTPQYT